MNVNFDIPEEVGLTGVRIYLICKKCFGIWSIVLDPHFHIPRGGTVCVKCDNAKYDAHKEGKSNGQ